MYGGCDVGQAYCVKLIKTYNLTYNASLDLFYGILHVLNFNTCCG